MTKNTMSPFERLAQLAHQATTHAANESQLRANLEQALEAACGSIKAPWSPYSLDTYLPARGASSRFADAIHGAVIIEYEPPCSFRGRAGAQFTHACQQAQDYAGRLCMIEGRSITEYHLVVWDGESIAFGRTDGAIATWETLVSFDESSAKRLMNAIADNGRPLVSEAVLAQRAGPASEVGAAMIPVLFDALVEAESTTPATKTTLLFAEWKRLFGQVVGIGDGHLRAFVEKQSKAHGADYSTNTPAYLFALNTYIALLAKAVVARALEGAAEDILDPAAPLKDRIASLEDGTLFLQAGLLNMVTGDFFSWYASDAAWPRFGPRIEAILQRLADIDFDISRKSAHATRDLFKGIYESCVPRELRHALGEFYTPDWLAEHGLNVLGWAPNDSLLDPTCGSGTFLLEALRRRIAAIPGSAAPRSATALLAGLYGTDLNPLAVLAAKASIAVFIARYRQPHEQIRLPVYLADAINTTTVESGMFAHELQTERGKKRFVLPQHMVEATDFFQMMGWLQERIDEGERSDAICVRFRRRYPHAAASEDAWNTIGATVETVVDLHDIGWNGIWCSILANRFAAGAITDISHVCGNPPWVKWSHLPRDYAAFIKPRCDAIGVFSEDTWVGGIEADISTVITYETIDRYLAEGGKLGFFITGTVFTNESSEGFRKFSLRQGKVQCAVQRVEDYRAIRPFDGVSNHPTFLMLKRGAATRYPVNYYLWEWKDGARALRTAADFTQSCNARRLIAKPVPGGAKDDCRPWLIGTQQDLVDVVKVFRRDGTPPEARKGVTTDRNGIFWVSVLSVSGGLAHIRNCHDVGRTKGIVRRTGQVEAEHVFPLLRGQDVMPFKATPSGHILVPQRAMHGDPALPEHSPLTFAFLKRFKAMLEVRSSFKRFQKGQPWWSLWSTGAYTFAAHKVAWREMSGGSFFAAYVGRVADPKLGKKVIIPDHKVYFITCKSAAAAHFTAGYLNSPLVAKAINAYASPLSLGTSVAEYIGIPAYDAGNHHHVELSKLSAKLATRTSSPTDQDYVEIDRLARLVP